MIPFGSRGVVVSNKIFTFGREHEKRCATSYVRKQDDRRLIESVIDSVHDVLEGAGSLSDLAIRFGDAFAMGGSGVWESAGSWIIKMSKEFPEIGRIWVDLSRHSRAEVRFRVACFLNDVDQNIFDIIGPTMLSDRSKKVLGMAQDRARKRGASPA